MENNPSQEETSLGVLDHDAVRSSLEALTKKKRNEKIVAFRMKSATKKVQENPSPFEVWRMHRLEFKNQIPEVT